MKNIGTAVIKYFISLSFLEGTSLARGMMINEQLGNSENGGQKHVALFYLLKEYNEACVLVADHRRLTLDLFQ